MFISNPRNSTYKTKLVLLSEQIEPSHISNNDFCWHFAIGPPPAIGSPHSPLTGSGQANSPVGRPSLRSHDSNPKFQLQITIHRRGFLTRKIRSVFFTRRGRRLTLIQNEATNPLHNASGSFHAFSNSSSPRQNPAQFPLVLDRE